MDSDRRELSLAEHCQEIEKRVEASRADCKGDTTALLALLRTLEGLHRQVFEEDFVPSLPNSRQPLYALLREMEAEGGWPYIPKMRIYELIDYLNAQAQAEEATEPDEDV
ncbi:MAG: hypothetical protein ACFB9N_10375 [Geitlerinemataceae cyanobacterium]